MKLFKEKEAINTPKLYFGGIIVSILFKYSNVAKKSIYMTYLIINLTA